MELKALADEEMNVAQMMISVFYWFEIIVGKGENAGYKHFLLFLPFLQKPSSLGSLNSGQFGKGFKGWGQLVVDIVVGCWLYWGLTPL